MPRNDKRSMDQIYECGFTATAANGNAYDSRSVLERINTPGAVIGDRTGQNVDGLRTSEGSAPGQRYRAARLHVLEAADRQQALRKLVGSRSAAGNYGQPQPGSHHITYGFQ